MQGLTKQKTNYTDNKYRSEQGYFMPFLAVLGTSLMAVVFIVGFNSMLLRRSTALFRDRSEQSCKMAIDRKDFVEMDSMLNGFANAVNVQFRPEFLTSALAGNRFTLTKADIIVPTMPDGEFDFSDSNGYAPLTAATSFTSLGLTACNVVNGSDCRVQGQTFQGTPSVTSPRPIPKGVMHPRADAVATVGCIFEGTVKAFNLFNYLGASDQVPIRAVYSYWRPVSGYFPNYDPGIFINADGSVSGSINVQDAPGLSLAISTHMQTDVSDVRFQWPTGNAAGINEAYNPVYGVAANGTNFGYTNSFTSNSVMSAGPFSSAQFDASYPYSPAYELAVNCMSPPVLVRNIITSTILQHAARHGQLRNTTEVLHVGTTHRWFDNAAIPTSTTSDTQGRNMPVKLVELGSDLVHPDNSLSYQLPFVYYDSGGGPADWDAVDDANPLLDSSYLPPTFRQGISALSANFGYNAFGRINPFVDDEKPGRSHPEWRRHHSLVANQLRMCAHLYSNTGASASIVTPHIGMYSGASLEPPELTDSSDGWTGAVFPSTMATLDQTFPVGSGYGRDDLPLANAGGVDAISLVGMLGSTQACPFRDLNLWNNSGSFEPLFMDDGSGNTYCKKPVSDLSPDLLGLMYYLGLNTSLYQAVSSPGLFQLSQDRDRSLTSASESQPPFTQVSPRKNNYLPLVLVLHKTPTDSESAVIKDLLSGSVTGGSFWYDRPIIVVFIPENAYELGRADTLYETFRARFDGNLSASDCAADAGCNEDQNFRNVVYVLDPRRPTDGSADNFCSGASHLNCADADFQAYWLELISGGLSGGGITLGSEFGAASIGRAVFNRLIKPAERKY